MSSVRGAPARGRGRGSTQQPALRGRGASTARGRGFSTNATRASTAARGTFGQASRQNATPPAQAPSGPRAKASSSQAVSKTGPLGGVKTTGSSQERWQALTNARDHERADAIARGLIADPEKPRALAEAITPVGTCQDMCAEYERVQRMVQSDVWEEERDPNHSAYARTERPPDESRMVKKFRRSAAGNEEQLPSDLRPPPVLKRTCDYLFNDMIGNARSLADVHHFVWDRTRAIRNDFSIQQVQKRDELRIAIECYERIARFHIMSLHQLALPEKPYSKYDYQQEREQLDRTLLSLMQLYDDSRERIELPNEAEFRAYCVIMQLQDPIPDLEDRIQSWPRPILQDRRVQKALEVYMAACNIMDPQGPLKPRADHLIARQDWQKFWALVASKEVSYLMACAAEVYFNLVRRTVLNALFRTSRQMTNKVKTPEWTIDVLCDLLAFDEGDEVYTYCERFGFDFKGREDGEHYLDLTSVGGTTLPEPEAGMPKQSKSNLVEDKRFGRSLPAIINGLTVKQARVAGLVTEQEEDDEMSMDDVQEPKDLREKVNEMGSSESVDDGDSLFIPETKRSSAFQSQIPMPLQTSGRETSTPSGFAAGLSFGQPSTFSDKSGGASSQQSVNAQKPSSSAPAFNFLQAAKPATPAAFSFTDTLAAAGASTGPIANSKPTAPAFGEPPPNYESIVSKPPAPSSTATPPRFQFPIAPAIGSTSLGKPTTKESNTSLFPTQSTPTPITSVQDESSKPQPVRSQFSFTQAAETPATLLPRQPSKSPETKATQPHFTPPPTSLSASLNSLPPTSGLNAGARKLSASRDHRPEKPSPLSYSFTAGEDSSAIDDTQPLDSFVSKPLPRVRFAAPESPTSGFGSAPTKQQPQSLPEPPADDFDAIVTKIADEFYTDPVRGILKQYIEYYARRTVREVRDQIESEQLAEEADRHHRFRLQKKYANRWRALFWQKKVAKSGRERRERRQRRLQQRLSQEVEGGSFLDLESCNAHSQASSVFGAENFGVRQSVESEMFARLTSYHNASHAVEATSQPHAGIKRPTSSHGPAEVNHARQHAHKRMKSTSHIDDRGRVTKPISANNAGNDILERSSFLRFSPSNSGTTSKNTTKSNYFRLKALGIHRIDETITPRGTKRRLSASVQDSTQTSPPALRSPSLLGNSSRKSNDRVLMPPPSFTPSRTPKVNNDDEDLFARLKAARENLSDSTSFYKSEVGKEEELRQSLNSSQSSNEFESPSMAKARLDARMRASRGSSEAGVLSTRADVPAYRLRESRFVPREDYGKAIDRAKELRASRSRETSRPETPQTQDVTHEESKKGKAAAHPFGNPSLANPPSSFGVASTKGPNGLSHNQDEQSGPTKSAPNPTPLSFTSQLSNNFANHTTHLPSENPFLKASSGNNFSGFGFGSIPSTKAPTNNSVNGFGAQQPSVFEGKQQNDTGLHNFTVQPSQINQALANSFGSSHGHGTNQLLSLPRDMNTQPQQDSYLQSQTVTLLSDDEDDDQDASIQHPQINSTADLEETEESLGEVTNDYQTAPMNGHVNPYELLARYNEDEEEQQSFDDEVDDVEEFAGYDGDAQNGFIHSEDEDEEAIDGDIDDDETEDIGEEGDGYGSEYDEEDEYPEHGHWHQPGYDDRSYAKPSTNTALQGVGSTAEEAIELSD